MGNLYDDNHGERGEKGHCRSYITGNQNNVREKQSSRNLLLVKPAIKSFFHKRQIKTPFRKTSNCILHVCPEGSFLFRNSI